MDFPVLSSLIHPLTPEIFGREFQGTEFHLSKGAGKNLSALFGWSELNEFLNCHAEHLKYPAIKLFRNGRLIPERLISEPVTNQHAGYTKLSAKKIAGEVASGATIILNAIEDFAQPIRKFTRELSIELQEIVKGNIYFSPSGARGFDEHFDTHDVFIVQLEGSKEWHLHGISHQYPHVSERYNDFCSPAGPCAEVLTEPGDVLYIPRGYWHHASARSPSLHLTIGIYRQTRIEILSWMVSQLINDPRMREDAHSSLDRRSLGDSLDLLNEAIQEQFNTKEGLISAYMEARRIVIETAEYHFDFP